MRRFVPVLAFGLASCAHHPTPDPGPAPAPESTSSSGVAVLVMAHGGSAEWNADVRQAVARLNEETPAIVAFGMANRSTLVEGLETLREGGAERVAVVRLFLSGASFLDQTEYYLGLSDAAPRHFLLMGPGSSEPSARTPIEHDLEIATHLDGLLGSPEARTILVERALEVSRARANESVLILAHGMGDDQENDDVLDAMRPPADDLESLGFARARVATLREDWEEARAVAEEEIRSFVDAETRAGRRVIVVPARLSGFGPYAEVLSGLRYEGTAGMLPHEQIEGWLRSTAVRTACAAGWGEAIGPCDNPVVRPETTGTGATPHTPRSEASSRHTPAGRAR